MSDLSAKPEKNYRAKTKQADSQSGYLEDKVVGSTYINITEEDGTVGKRLKVEVDASALVAGVVDHKVKVSSNDTTANYLLSKLVAGNAITLAKQNPEGNEKIIIDADYTAGTGIDIDITTISLDADLDDLNDVVIGAGAEGQLISYDSGTSKFVNTDYAMETTFSGTTSKVPTSKAVAELLQDLYITDATNCGSSGDALIHKVKDIPLGSCTFVEVTSDPSFYLNYPLLGEIMSKTPTWDTSGDYGRGKGNSLMIYSGMQEYTAAICNLSIDEDIDMIADSTLYVDVLFECTETGEGNYIANVKCQPFLYSGSTLVSALPYLPSAEIEQVEYPATGSIVRKITYEITLGDQCPDGKWFYGALVFSCDASANIKSATIIGLRTRYATKTIGLRIDDVD